MTGYPPEEDERLTSKSIAVRTEAKLDSFLTNHWPTMEKAIGENTTLIKVLTARFDDFRGWLLVMAAGLFASIGGGFLYQALFA